MKKILAAATFLALAVSAGAQNMYDAMTFSQNQYYGTARSMAMGNAVTALGGDLGSVVINPAGSAVAGYGQFTITPGFTLSAVNSAWSPEGENSYGSPNGLSQTRMNLPNVGLSMEFKTGRRSGVKALTFSVISSQTDNYNFASEAFGTNSRTSKIAEFADAAYGYAESVLANYNSFNNSDAPWDLLTSYQGGMYGPYGWDGLYAGVTESIADDASYHYVPGALSQTSSRTKRGSKNDLIMNLGLNISDRVYVGFNVGLPSARYRYNESFYESAVDPGQFPIIYEDMEESYVTYFNRGTYSYDYMADVTGIYAKIGVILRPTDALRLGATFQTPTAYTVSERWQHYASTTFDDSYYNDSQYSPEGEYEYTLRSPYRASFGLAYTLGKAGAISVDYELADYSVMRFSELHRNRLASDAFLAQNLTNRYFAGVAHSVRVGGEFKVTPEFAVRAGYTLATSPERYWTDSSGMTVTADDYADNFYDYYDRVKNLVTPHYYKDRTQSFAFGFGYSSPGSFFLDAVARLTRYPAMTFAPYFDYDSYDKAGNLQSVLSPRVHTDRSLWNVALTFGWRF
ncbi:MAG: outer membrane protein transport protein [Bacteroidales bacterium]|nr:outer membrane protein transport protein [Bacteroidales bacterium]